ncbi:MAG: hypothetical protein K2P75_04830 [Sphingobacteriaceae bacterium]|nr:hypothetical protein [Sphingobacteriaceae bacterium]
MNNNLALNKSYISLLEEIKQTFQHSRLKAAIVVNRELLQFYWEVGNLIIQKQQQSSWGDKLKFSRDKRFFKD